MCREMFLRNDWVVPTFNKELRTDKPPLHYYHMMLAYKVFGINSFGARFFSIVVGMSTVFAVYFFGRKLANEQTAFLAALMLVCSIQLAVQFHLAVPDPYLIFFLTFGWLSFIFAYLHSRHWFYYVFYVSISLATMAKGPVAIFFSGLVVLTFLVAQRKLSFYMLSEIKIFQGIFIFMIIVLPWYILVGMETDGAWLEQFFLKHNINRFTTPMEGHGGFPLASFVIAIGALMPFSFFFPQAIRSIWKIRKSNTFMQFCLIAFLVVVVFFSLSRTILPSYPEPALPFFALMLGYFISLVEENSGMIRGQRLVINAILYMVVAALIPFVVWSGIDAEDNLRDLSYLAYYFSFLPVGAALGIVFILQKRIVYAIWSYSLAAVIFLICFFYLLFPLIDRRNPVSQSLSFFSTGSKPIYHYKEFNPAFVFALQTSIAELRPLADSLHRSAGEHGFYVITQKRYLPELDTLQARVVYEGKDLFERQHTVILEKIGR